MTRKKKRFPLRNIGARSPVYDFEVVGLVRAEVDGHIVPAVILHRVFVVAAAGVVPWVGPFMAQADANIRAADANRLDLNRSRAAVVHAIIDQVKKVIAANAIRII